MCVGTSTIRLRSIKSSLPFSLPLRHSSDKFFQALSRFSVLEVTESWAGPGNEATKDASNQNQSLSVVEKLLLFVKLGSCRKPSYLGAFLAFLCNHATKELLQGQMRKIKETPNFTRNADL